LDFLVIEGLPTIIILYVVHCIRAIRMSSLPSLSPVVVCLSNTKRFAVFVLVISSTASSAESTTGYTVSSTLQECAVHVLSCSDLLEKVSLTSQYVTSWHSGAIATIYDNSSSSTGCTVPACPSRPPFESTDRSEESLFDNNRLKQLGLNKNSIQISLHGIAHAESWALDLFWDVIARFCNENMPKEFYDDMVSIAGQEANHFMSWHGRLHALGCDYGTLPTHNGLWRAADSTKGGNKRN
jgi:uncharacterized ferritin-like protein (DUF455 family)